MPTAAVLRDLISCQKGDWIIQQQPAGRTVYFLFKTGIKRDSRVDCYRDRDWILSVEFLDILKSLRLKL